MRAATPFLIAGLACALAGCAAPAARQAAASPELAMLAKAAEDAARSQQLLARMTVVNSGDKAMQDLKASLASTPSNDLNRLYSTEYVGVPHGIVQDIAQSIGWRFEERGSADVDSIVRIKSASQPVIAVLRSIGDQFPFVLAVDEKSRTIVLDYTRSINDTREPKTAFQASASKPLIQKYSMDGGIFADRKLAARVADGYKTQGFAAQVRPAGRKFQIAVGPYVDDGAGERKVRETLGLHQRVE
ncbi:DotD/TraH family lipoprotein [Chromobacterium subtsugae]|uniref:DotD/TraH family lipoprotein n=1 Tax=Chromobacterium subtsugae TaxID=251747 RepID=UPI000A98BB60|nr:DotD/TraH family lipoprotein [Chromobacterium subtsugae]